jgi:hypothetical protein
MESVSAVTRLIRNEVERTSGQLAVRRPRFDKGTFHSVFPRQRRAAIGRSQAERVWSSLLEPHHGPENALASELQA